MNDEHKETTALATATTLTDDHLLAIADAAEKRVEAVKKIKILALRVTNPQDWIDQNGKPYLQVSGAEKIARLFGISWQLEPPDIDFDDERHFMWTFKGTFSMGTAEIEAIGTRSSKDAFFSRSHGRDIPPTEIDRGDVKKAAFTNCIGNGVTRLLGLRNLTWAEVRQGGVNQEKVSKVEYKNEPKREDAAATGTTEHNLGTGSTAPQQTSDAPAPSHAEADLGILFQDLIKDAEHIKSADEGNQVLNRAAAIEGFSINQIQLINKAVAARMKALKQQK